MHKEMSESVYLKAGNIGVNKAPTVALDILGNVKIEGTSVYTGDVTYSLTNGASFLGSSFTTTLQIDAANNRVGIGTAFPGTALDVCGTISATSTTVANSTTCLSDIRFKENIQPLENSLDKISQMRGVHYDWKIKEFPKKGFSEDKQIGFIAQEIEKLFPELVQTNEDGYKSVSYDKMTPILVEAVKEQQDIINTQKEEIAVLQQQVDELQGLKAQVAALTGMVSALNQGDEGDQGDIENTGEKE